MKEKSELLSADDFFEKLQQDKLDTTVPFSLIGMVKKSEGKGKTIEFVPGRHCADWVTIPLEYIEDVEIIKTITCKDHSHPLVKLKMKTPKTLEGKFLLALLGSTNSNGLKKPVAPEPNFFPLLNPDNEVYPEEMMGIPGAMARQLQPDGTIIYKKKCKTKYAWVCDGNGCRWIPYTECLIYPEFGLL